MIIYLSWNGCLYEINTTSQGGILYIHATLDGEADTRVVDIEELPLVVQEAIYTKIAIEHRRCNL